MKKMIAPLVIVLILLAYLAFVVIIVFAAPDLNDEVVSKVIAVVVATLVAGPLIAVFWQRYKEIKRGDEDDLGKY